LQSAHFYQKWTSESTQIIVKWKKGSVQEFRNFVDEELALKMFKRGLGVLGIKETDLGAQGKGALEKRRY
jgi:hypothetical protein